MTFSSQEKIIIMGNLFAVFSFLANAFVETDVAVCLVAETTGFIQVYITNNRNEILVKG